VIAACVCVRCRTVPRDSGISKRRLVFSTPARFSSSALSPRVGPAASGSLAVEGGPTACRRHATHAVRWHSRVTTELRRGRIPCSSHLVVGRSRRLWKSNDSTGRLQSLREAPSSSQLSKRKIGLTSRRAARVIIDIERTRTSRSARPSSLQDAQLFVSGAVRELIGWSLGTLFSNFGPHVRSRPCSSENQIFVVVRWWEVSDGLRWTVCLMTGPCQFDESLSNAVLQGLDSSIHRDLGTGADKSTNCRQCRVPLAVAIVTTLATAVTLGYSL